MSISSFLDLHTMRDYLTDQSSNGPARRERLFRHITGNVVCCRVGMEVSGLMTFVSLTAMKAIPILGLCALLGGLGMIAIRDGSVLAKNTLEMMPNRNAEGNIPPVNLSAEEFRTRITRDTWIIGPLFGPAIRLGLA